MTARGNWKAGGDIAVISVLVSALLLVAVFVFRPCRIRKNASHVGFMSRAPPDYGCG
jgi:hypothetical protein